jgi:hypothetical protein
MSLPVLKLLTPFGFPAPKEMIIICLSNMFALHVPGEG